MKLFFASLIFPLLAKPAVVSPLRPVECRNGDQSISVTLDLVDGKPVSIDWLKARSEPIFVYKIVSSATGTEMWPPIPARKLVDFLIGSYVGKGSYGTLILNVLRPASFGGGGYDWEGS